MSPSKSESRVPRALLPPADSPRSTAEKVANYIRTLIFNGYGEYVADIYKGLEKERLYV